MRGISLSRARRWAACFVLLAPPLVLAQSVTAAASRLCGPVFSTSGPDAAGYGLEQNYPIGTIVTRDKQDRMVASYSNFDTLLPFHKVPASSSPSVLHRNCEAFDVAYRFDGVPYGVNDYLARNPATGLLIAKGSTILLERYQYARTDTDRFVSQSMVKTMVAMLVGIAMKDGLIRSLDDLAQDYLPRMKGSAFGETSLRALLTMSAGVAFTETYDGNDDVARFGRNLRRPDLPDAAGLLAQFDTRDAAPETLFHYTGAQTELLGLVLSAVTGKTLAQYLSEKIWQPMGAEADASWSIDAHDQAMAYCCFTARLRDYARLGILLANDGGGVIPSAWVIGATSVPDGSFRAPRVATPFYGYGYQTWIFPTRRRMFALLGVHGQAIFVDPESKLVMVHTAVRLKPNKDPAAREMTALWFGLLRSMGASAALK